MPRKPAKPHDFAQAAFHVVRIATGEEPPDRPLPAKNPKKVEAGRVGGKKGGKTRADNLSPRRRKQIASEAAKARWKK